MIPFRISHKYLVPTLLVTAQLISSCSSSVNDPLPMNSVSEVGTNGELVSINSDNVQAAGYESTTKIMTVQFDNGATYQYFDVEPEIWNLFIAAQPHPWSQVGYPILVEGNYLYTRIN